MTTTERWPSHWLRGTLQLCVLAVVAEETTYGYAITRRLKAAGLGSVNGGTLYPILTRLERDGLVTSSWQDGSSGPGRKYFAITPAGLEHLTTEAGLWQAFSATVTALVAARTREEIPA
jgi:PadR family transcriptional regulator PadR